MTMESLKKEIKDLIKVNNRNVVESQRVEQDLIGQARKKDKEIFDLKAKLEECTCFRYTKSMDEVIKYGQKHKAAVIELKQVAENLKEKNATLRGEKSSLQTKVDYLEFEAQTDCEIILNHKDKIEFLETEKRKVETSGIEKDSEIAEKVLKIDELSKLNHLFREKLGQSLKESKLQQEAHSENIQFLEDELETAHKALATVKLDVQKKPDEVALDAVQVDESAPLVNAADSLSMTIKDLKDEIIHKSEEIKWLKEIGEKKDSQEVLKSSSSSLAEELKFVYEEDIKEKIQIEKNNMLEKIALLATSNEKDFKILKANIKKLEPKDENPKCRFGKKCWRLFCRFSHRHLFVKINNIENMKKRVYECAPSVDSSTANNELKKHSTKHAGQDTFCNPLISVSVDIHEEEEEEQNSETSSDTNLTESEFEDSHSEETSDSSEYETGEVLSDVS